MNIYFILWITIQYNFIYFVAQIFSVLDIGSYFNGLLYIFDIYPQIWHFESLYPSIWHFEHFFVFWHNNVLQDNLVYSLPSPRIYNEPFIGKLEAWSIQFMNWIGRGVPQPGMHPLTIQDPSEDVWLPALVIPLTDWDPLLFSTCLLAVPYGSAYCCSLVPLWWQERLLPHYHCTNQP